MGRIISWTGFLTATACALLAASILVGQEPSVPTRTPASEPGAVSTPLAAEPVGRPSRVTIPAIDVSENLRGVGLQANGDMETPDFGQAGWYELGPRPGAPGPAVIVAHVHGPAGDDVFARLHQLRSGDLVRVRHADGVATFVVQSVEQVRKERLPRRRIWNDTTRPVLRLVTCGGEPDPVTRVYPDNTIVFARSVD